LYVLHVWSAHGTVSKQISAMKINHPKQWEYCMKPFEEGGLGLKHVLEVLNVTYE